MDKLKDQAAYNALTSQIVGAAIEVHRAVGPGLLESIYEECLCAELKLRGLSFQRQLKIPLRYKGLLLNCDYRVDLLVAEAVVVELKSVAALLAVHEAQLLTYLRMGNWKLGLLLNFNVPVMKSGIKRIANGRLAPDFLAHPDVNETNKPSIHE